MSPIKPIDPGSSGDAGKTPKLHDRIQEIITNHAARVWGTFQGMGAEHIKNIQQLAQKDPRLSSPVSRMSQALAKTFKGAAGGMLPTEIFAQIEMRNAALEKGFGGALGA